MFLDAWSQDELEDSATGKVGEVYGNCPGKRVPYKRKAL